MLIGLTGGIGSGKTLASNYFAALGVTVVDADVVAREVVAPGTPGLKQIVSRHGESILTADGALDRGKLRGIILNDEQEKEWLDQCLHPLIRLAMAKEIQSATGPYTIVVVPLLAENHRQYDFDRIIVIDCDEEMQIARASERDNTSLEKIKGMMAYQASRKERLAIADDVIENNGSLEEMQEKVESLHRHYLSLLNSTERKKDGE